MKSFAPIACILVLGMMALAESAPAQAADSVKLRNDCRLAAQVLRTGHPAPQRPWALSKILLCGPEGGSALSQAMRDARASADTALHDALTAPASRFRDGTVFQAAVDVAEDVTADPVARVFAFRVLAWALRPNSEISYVDLTGTRCYGSGPSLHIVVFPGSPLPADYVERIHATTQAVLRLAGGPATVRRAAACVSMMTPVPWLPAASTL